MSTLGLIIAGGTVAYTALLTPSPAFKKTAIDFSVHDEQGLPVEGVHVVYYHVHWIAGTQLIRVLNFIPKLQERDTFVVKQHVVTDAQGKGKMRYQTVEPITPILVFDKDGWYKSYHKIEYEGLKGNTNLPYPMKMNITMKQMKNQMTTFVVQAEYLKYPFTSDEPVGYDMLKGDWMPPWGSGETEDITIKAQKFESKGPYSPRSTLEVTFQREGNGVQGIPNQLIARESQFYFPYLAFTDGYEIQELVVQDTYKRSSRDMTKKSNFETDFFFFRIRTQKDENGNVVSALYGIIFDTTAVSGGNKWMEVKLPYRINKTPNDRNIELAKDEYGRFIIK